MTDLSITAASVFAGTGAVNLPGIAGAAITAGEPLYIDSNNLLWPAKADTVPHAQIYGISTSNAAAGQPVWYVNAGYLTINAVGTIGATYVVSPANAGGIAPVADVTTGTVVTVLGIGISTTSIKLGFNASGATHA